MVIAIFTVLGLIIGSFLNAVIWRLYTGRSVASGRSMCPHCHHVLRWYDLIPVLSWIVLRRKCRDCHRPISGQYPAVELVTAGLFGASVAILHPATAIGWVDLAAWLWAVASLIALTVYDLRWYLLPDRIVLPAVAVVALDLVARAAIGHDWTLLVYPLLAGLAGWGFFLGINIVSNGRWLGGGDAKLLLLMGLVLGPTNLLVALFFAFNLASLVGLSLIAAGKKSRKDYLPFGPFLATGTVIGMFWGSTLVHAYLGQAGWVF